MSETQMADNRTSIYLSPRLVEEKARWKDSPWGGFSSRLTNAVARVDYIAQYCRPELTRNEWFAVLDALNGYHMGDDMFGVSGIPFEIAEAVRINFLDVNFGFDRDEFLSKVEKWGPAQNVAVAEIANDFWREPNQNIDAFLEKVMQPPSGIGFDRLPDSG
jgi:hypothetical protein